MKVSNLFSRCEKKTVLWFYDLDEIRLTLEGLSVWQLDCKLLTLSRDDNHIIQSHKKEENGSSQGWFTVWLNLLPSKVICWLYGGVSSCFCWCYLADDWIWRNDGEREAKKKRTRSRIPLPFLTVIISHKIQTKPHTHSQSWWREISRFN